MLETPPNSCAALDLSPERGCHLSLVKSWLAADSATALQGALTQSLTWEAREIVLFGKRVLQPRLIAWAGDRPYHYSGQTLEAREFPHPIKEIQIQLEKRIGHSFNHVLLNRYRNGEDSMGWHSDDERELGKAPTLASLSLGCPRRFLLRPRPSNTNTRKLELWLEHGDLLVMAGALQARYQHSVPKQRGLAAERINLTFRKVQV